MKTSKFITALVTVAMVSFTSCNKEDASDTIDDSVNSIEFITLDASIDQVESIVEVYSMYGSDLIFRDNKSSGSRCHDRSGFFSDCAVIEEVIEDTTSTITMTFPDDCTDKNDDVISGSITIVKSTSETDKSRAITFVDFTVNGFVVNGTKSHSYTTTNANGNPQTEGAIDITVVTDAGTITKTGSRVVEVTSGGDTDTHQDDEKTYTGAHIFTDAEGNSKAVEITTALVKPAGCKYIASGIKEYTENGEIASLDYGDGTCDDIASLTAADGTVTEIELKRGRRGSRH